MAFVALDRRFLPWNEKNGSAAEHYAIYGSERNSLSWQDLLEKRRVVILAEAGGGKTEELKAQARLLGAAGKFAFYVTVQDIAREGLDGALGFADRHQLDSWRDSDQMAWLFVDSIDEAKLDGLRLETALRKLADAVHRAPARAHIIVSGRITDWEFRADLERFSTLLTVPPDRAQPAPPSADAILVQALQGETRRKKEDSAEQPLVVLMATLDEQRVRAFAAGKGVVHLGAFIVAIEDANLWSFARRPLDLDWLVAYWQKHGRFGALAAMVEMSLTERLQEPNPQYTRTDPIAPDHAMRALERIGAAMVFGRFDKLDIPDPEIVVSSSDPKHQLDQILPDWPPEHRRRLLARAVFDPATFGRVRLHNDNEGDVRAFLATKWLLRRRQENCSVRNLLDLLFADSYSYSLIKPSLRQTAAWLAIWDSDVAREVVQREPVLLLTAGDPASLPADVRAAALTCVVDNMSRSGERAGMLNEEALRRFATTDLIPQARTLWAQHKSVEPVRILLLRMIWLGRLNANADIAAEAVFGSYTDAHTLIFGGRALISTADAATIDRYAKKVVADASRMNGRVLWEALDQLFMRGLSVAEFLAIVGAMDASVRDSTMGMRYLGPNFVARVTGRDDLEYLLTGLMVLIGEGNDDYVAPETALETAFYPSIAATAHALMQIVRMDEAPESVLDAALRLSASRRFRGVEEEQREVLRDLAQTPQRRRLLFWRAADRFADSKKLRGQPLESDWQLQILGWPSKLQTEDIAWLIADAPLRPSNSQKRLALDAAMVIWHRNGRPDATLGRIRAMAETDPILADALQVWLTPRAVSPYEEESRQQIAAMETQRAEQEATRQKSWKEFLDPLRANPDQLRQIPPPTPQNIDGRLFYLWELLRVMDEHQSRYAIDDVTPLEPILGAELTAAFRDALVGFWRHWTPTLESARAPDKRNLVSKLDCMAIAAISLEAKATPDWPASLSPEDAAKAAAFATLELNGFPSWLPNLATAWPDQVGVVLLHEINSELDDPAPGPRYGTLQDVAHAPIEVARVVARALLRELKKRPELVPPLLSPVLLILGRGTPVAEPGFTALLLERAGNTADLDRAAYYLGAAFQRDASAAVILLGARLDALGPTDQRQLVEQLLPRLIDDPLERANQPPPLPIDVLERLVRIAFRTVRAEDDKHHEDGKAYMTDDRDRAEGARAALFNQLAAMPGRATIEVLRRLGNEPDIPISVKRLEELCYARAAEDAERSPWLPDEACSLERQFDNAPNTPADLQGVAIRRLADIEHDLHHSDFAQGATLKALKDETAVQVWVANELRNRQRRAYSVEREPHVVGEKEPDIRLRARATDSSLPIEIKVTKRWTLSQFEDALIVQLGARYLRDQDGKHGLLLLVHQKVRTRGWKVAAGKFLTFSQVVAHLRRLADEKAAEASDAPQAKVVVLDVSDLES
jgi:hypothetical protein